MASGKVGVGLRFLGWGIAILALVLLDVLTGPRIRFPVMLAVPVALLARYYERRLAVALAVLLPLPRLLFPWIWDTPRDAVDMVANAIIRGAVFVFIAVLVAKVMEQRRALEKEVEVLRGILPICMYCKKIRSAEGDWERLEAYITRHSEAEFSHGLCEECAKEHYPKLFSKPAKK